MATVVYTDGACSGNPGPGGWAWAVEDGRFASGAENPSTNQRMEIQAAHEAVLALPGPLEVVSDSTYVVHCFRDKWWEGWRRKNWHNSQRKPVANRDLWEPFIDAVLTRGDVTFRWVKGHSGIAMNDFVDQLAVEACGVPTNAKPETAQADASIQGHGLGVFGHRPTELGGYDDSGIAAAVRAKMIDIFDAKAVIIDDLVVVSGLRLGAEMLGAEAALDVGLPLVVVLPYPEPESVWPAASQQRFRGLRDQALDVVLLQTAKPNSKQQAGAALAKRDAWIVDHVNEALLVWDGSDPALGKLFRSMGQRLGDDVWVLDPADL